MHEEASKAPLYVYVPAYFGLGVWVADGKDLPPAANIRTEVDLEGVEVEVEVEGVVRVSRPRRSETRRTAVPLLFPLSPQDWQ